MWWPSIHLCVLVYLPTCVPLVFARVAWPESDTRRAVLAQLQTLAISAHSAPSVQTPCIRMTSSHGELYPEAEVAVETRV